MVEILYGKGTMRCPVEPDAVLALQEEHEASSVSGSELVRQAMANPYGGKTLAELAQNKKRVTVIISDHTRPVPSKDILPHLLRELRECADISAQLDHRMDEIRRRLQQPR